MTRPRLLLVAALAAGIGLLGSSAKGVSGLDRDLAAAAEVAATVRNVEVESHRDRDCPWREGDRKRREAQAQDSTTF